MKTTKKDFEYFKQECGKWIEKLGLMDWEIHYWHQNPKDKYADAEVSKDVIFRRADVKFSIDRFDPGTFSYQYLSNLAKHEMLHVFLGNLTDLARERSSTQEQITKAEEEIIRKLEKLL